MKTIAVNQGKRTGRFRRHNANPARQRGMGATIVLFTIALIVLVGAALAYASRSNPNAINVAGARVYSSILLKQSAEYRDAYSRFVFNGGNPATMTFNAAGLPAGDLFNPADQFGIYQAPPPQATTVPAVASNWLYNVNAPVEGIGTGAGESITYVPTVNEATCSAANFQLYGATAIPTSALAAADLAAPGAAITMVPSIPGRAAGCFRTSDGAFVFYSTLSEA